MCDENESKNTPKTAFSVLIVHFPDPGDKLKTVEFLEASRGVVTLVGKYKIAIRKYFYAMQVTISFALILNVIILNEYLSKANIIMR